MPRVVVECQLRFSHRPGFRTIRARYLRFQRKSADVPDEIVAVREHQMQTCGRSGPAYEVEAIARFQSAGIQFPDPVLRNGCGGKGMDWQGSAHVGKLEMSENAIPHGELALAICMSQQFLERCA